jgi:purine-binding chemotaxis protein CheW
VSTQSKQDTVSDLLQLVSFVIEGEEFGIDILKVQEIIRPVPITRVPNAPAFVEGVINLRGRIVPVIDARRRFGLPAREMDEDSRIVVVELPGRTVGFVMDAVREVIRVERSVIEPPPELAIGIDADYLSGVAKLDDRLLILLDVERVLADEEQAALPDALPQGAAAAVPAAT